MRSNSNWERPPIPDTWGSENVTPTQSHELMNENIHNFVIHETKLSNQHPVSNISVDSLKDLSPMEEYLQMTKRLIESNSLSPRTTIILKDLYIRYKSIKNHNSKVWDMSFDTKSSRPFIEDKKKKKIIINSLATKIDPQKHLKKSLKPESDSQGHDFETDKSLLQTSSHPKKDAISEGTVFHLGREEKPSTSKKQEQSETPSIDSKESDELNERQKSILSRISKEEAEQRWIKLQVVQDYGFDRPCDPGAFNIDNVFSNFSLHNEGHDKSLKKRISKWMTENQGLSAGSSEGNPDVDNVKVPRKTLRWDLKKKNFQEKMIQK